MIIVLAPARGFLSRCVSSGDSLSLLSGRVACNGRAMQNAKRRRVSPPPVAMSTRRTQTAAPSPTPRSFTKRKIAMYIAYDGARYSGFQKNDGVRTVSEVLEDALNKAGAIQDSNHGSLSKVSWIVAARTDKGVSAASNCVSFKATFPRVERDADATELSLDLSTFADCVNAYLPPDVRVFGAAKPTSSFSAKEACGGRSYEYLLPSRLLPDSMPTKAFASILQRFEGTHSFHNFTIGEEHRLPPPARASRYITRCSCDPDPLSIRRDAAEETFVRIRVQGQSFMLHQIRKMVALALLVARDAVVQDAVEKALDREVLTNIPPAPAVGLFLDTLHFEAYNKRFADHLTHPIELDSLSDLREDFKTRHIYPSILARIAANDEFPVFLQTVSNHPPWALLSD